jgi:acyl dehydratase
MNGHDGSGKWFDEVRVGERFARTLTVTETHLVLGAGLIGDFNPHHTDEEYARRSRFGTRILHGMITSAIMGAPARMYFHGTALAYLEHNARFTAPVRAGDTLTTTWTIVELLHKPKQGGGIVVLTGVARNQEGAVVAEALGKILVASRPPAASAAGPSAAGSSAAEPSAAEPPAPGLSAAG